MKKIKQLACILVLILTVSFVTAENVVLESDALKLELHEQTGSFTLYRKTGSKGKLLALNDVSDSSSSTFFAVKMNGVTRPLSRSYDVTVNCKANADGSASLVWEISGTLSVEACFTLMPAVSGTDADTVRVDMVVMNLSEKDVVCSLKAVIDTVLGETGRTHFTTAKGTAVSNEREYTTMVLDKWFSSTNGTDSVAVILAGSNATNPDYVLAANRDLLLSDTWKPVANEGRTFDTFQSPNNSALGIWYENVKLRFFETFRRTFFITTASDDEALPVASLVGPVSETEEYVADEGTVEAAAQIVDAVVEAAVYQNLSEDINTSAVDYAYIQSLLDRIAELDASGNPDAEEISRLNTEIDALLLELTR
ncbi:MAG: hypothetical protein KBT02_03555 [Treponema sp.]|nr:hypothetical protein [Candidatus Treponema caballi]